MRWIAFLLLFSPAYAQWTPEQVFRFKRIGSVRPSPVDDRVAYVVSHPVMESEKSEWRSVLYLDGQPFTDREVNASQPAWSPDGKWLAFVSNRHGKNGIWKIGTSGGEAARLCEERGSVQDLQWAPDGKTLAYVVAPPNTADEERAKKEKTDVKVVDENPHLHRLCVVTAGGGSSRTFANDVHVRAGLSWSPDSRRVYFSHQASPNFNEWPTSDISYLDVDTGKMHPVASTPAAEQQPWVSPDGKWLAFTKSDEPARWAFADRVYLMPLNGGPARALAPTPDEQPWLLGFRNGALWFMERERTLVRVGRLPLDGGAPQWFSPEQMVGQPALGKRLAYVGETFEKPPEVFVTDTSDFAPAQVSHVQPSSFPPFGKTEIIRWKSGDLEIEGLLTRPLRVTGKAPLALEIHGGPTGVFDRSFLGRPGPYTPALFSSRGVAVLRCNVRGSSGYGKAFRYANYADWGGADYQDLMRGVDHVVGMELADPARLSVMGWSYGGFMTSWVITQTDRFRAASVGAGVTDLVSFTGTADIPGFIPDYFEGDFWARPDIWRERSSVFGVSKVKTPTLIQHGEADTRVPVGQSYELYTALKRRGVPVKLVVYPRQGHGISEPKLMLDCLRRNWDWVAEWVLKPT